MLYSIFLPPDLTNFYGKKLSLGGVSYLVQYTIWQVGDVGLASLQPIFRLALQQVISELMQIIISIVYRLSLICLTE